MRGATKHSHYQPPAAQARWLVSLSDCMLQLLKIFVMLFAVSSVHNERWQEFAGSLAGALRPITVLDSRSFARPFASTDAGAGKRDVDYMAALLANTLANERGLAGFALTRASEGLVIRPPADAWQNEGISVRGQAGAALLADRLRLIDNELVVRVRTTPDSPNWTRAMTRGIALAEGLRLAGYPRDAAILGSIEPAPSGSAEVELVLRPARAGMR